MDDDPSRAWTEAELADLVRRFDACPCPSRSGIIASTSRSPRGTSSTTTRTRSTASAAGSGAAPVGSPTVSGWAFLGRTPAVKPGPGESPRSHQPDELVTEDELARGVDA